MATYSNPSLPALSRGTSYASTDPSPLSSAVCTPGDEYSPMLDNVMVAEHHDSLTPRPHCIEFDVSQISLATPKVRSMSRAVSKAKLFASKTMNIAHVFKKTISVGNSARPSVLTMVRQKGGWHGGDSQQRESSNFPNPEINASESRHESCLHIDGVQIVIDAPEETGEDDGVVLKTQHAAMAFEEVDVELRTTPNPLTWHKGSLTLLRVLFFLPWCVAVGGTILLSPTHLEHVAFAPGYMDSPRGLWRFAHWADCAMHHVFIFLACVVALAWWNVTWGALAATAVAAQFVNAWHDFQEDLSIPLGEDDRQSVYLLAKGDYLDEDGCVTIKGRGLRAEHLAIVGTTEIGFETDNQTT